MARATRKRSSSSDDLGFSHVAVNVQPFFISPTVVVIVRTNDGGLIIFSFLNVSRIVPGERERESADLFLSAIERLFSDACGAGELTRIF